MNIVRKLRGAGSASVVGTAPSGGEPGDNGPGAHTQLGLMHLKKLFAEYTHPLHPLTESEKDDKLYNMLPLFCKVFGSSPSCDMNEKFWDILAFCQQVSQLMVAEIRRRASNQSTEAASCAIAKFLEIENCEESSNGWMLLSTLNLLAAGDGSLVQVMAEVAVPSTLVKCLYLFFDLPHMPEAQANAADAESDFTPRERRILLQKIFVQLLMRLCSHRSSAEELARKDDLTLLFSAITSWCPPHNAMWRKSAAEVLMTLSRHGLTPPVVAYIHSKGCVALCIDNMQRVPELAPLELVEMFVTVFCFLKDSSDVAATLLDDFRACQGYVFLSEFLLKLDQERDKSPEAQEAIRNLVLMVTSLCMCGYMELKPSQASMGSLFQLQGFALPQPAGRGTSVRNIQAFQVLQSTFVKSNSGTLCATILDAISSIYHSDDANYFILEGQNTLSQLAERIQHKPGDVQRKLFQLLEFVVLQLNFVPCKELISCSILLKSHSLAHADCCVACVHTLLTVLRHNAIFKEVYREVGMLEVFVACLNRYGALLDEREPLTRDQERLGALVMEGLTLLLAGSAKNAAVLRECGGARCVHALVAHPDCRLAAIGIIRELVLTTGGDDDMATLLGTLHSAPRSDLQLKTDILRALLACLRDSHRTRTVFRKVGGFVYVTSVLVALEGRLAENEPDPAVLGLLHIVFHTISTAMRFEPANAKFFHQDICMTSLCDTLRLLGCFSPTRVSCLEDSELEEPPSGAVQAAFNGLFTGSVLEPDFPEHVPPTLSYACIVMRLLYDVALDAFDKPGLSTSVLSLKSPCLSRQCSEQQQQLPLNGAGSGGKRSAVNSLNLNPPAPDPIVVHPGVVVAVLQLLPSVRCEHAPALALALQHYLAEVIKSLVRSERNQQLMCECGLVGQLLAVGSAALRDEAHPLHCPLQYMLERLAAQALEPTDLRRFLRLGDPLCCLPLGQQGAGPTAGGPVPLTRIKTLVSMTTPRDFRAQSSFILPPFVELDMSAEGFGCMYLPSIAPQSAAAPSVVSGLDSSVVGGIGAGDRLFPPQTGLTYSTWVCVDKFSDPRTDPHCVRLLTLVRHLNGSRDDHLICLSLVLSARDKAIIVSTHETLFPHNIGEWEPEGCGEHGARIWCPDLLHEGQWHHLVLVLNRAVLKNSSFSLYLDGQHMHTQKLHYISQNPGGGAANLTVASSVYGFIGTPPAWRRYSRLCWKQGVCHLVEEVLSPVTVAAIHQLGPHYMGSLQAPKLADPDVPAALVSEEKVMFGLNAKAMTQLTLAKIRKVYSRVDNKTIAKQLGMSSHENATPIRILHNSAGHLTGPARCLGGVVVGYLGVRVFCPRPVSATVDTVGGCSVLLGLIAMAQDVESLYAGVKALVCVVRSNRAAQAEMDRRRGYQTLAMLLRRKRPLLNSHILHLAFSLVGTVDSGRESSAIPNPTAFQDLLCDLEVWHEAPGELLRSHLEHLHELAAESSDKRNNVWLMRDLQLVTRLLHIVADVRHQATRHVLFSLLAALLAGQPRHADLLWFGQFVAATLPAPPQPERALALREADGERDGEGEAVLLRNRCLQLLHSLLFAPQQQRGGAGGGGASSAVSATLCDELVRTLGFDWVLLFLQPHLHPSTVVWGLRLLVALCSVPTLMGRFREGAGSGGWLRHTELVTHNKMAVVLGAGAATGLNSAGPTDGGPPGGGKWNGGDLLHVPGFQLLGWLLPEHLDVPETYFLLAALIMGQPARLLPGDSSLNLDTVWAFLWGVPLNSQPVSSVAPRVVICPEAVVVLLGMARSMLHRDQAQLPDWLRGHAVAIVQLLFALYHNMPDFMPVFMGAEVLGALAATLFPPRGAADSADSSGASTPAGDEPEPLILVRTPSDESPLTTHPARKFVVDFVRVIAVDSLSLSTSGKSAPVIDLVLDAYPENSSASQQTCYQTEVLCVLMEHLLAADMLVGDQAAIPVVPLATAHVQNIAPNVFYVAARVVDKLWQGALTKDPHEVFDFVVKLIGQARRRPASGLSLEGLHHCLNRTILFLLSRPTDSIADQMSVLEALHKLTTNRLIVFGAGNHELDFIGCLTYCLVQLTSDMKIMLDGQMRTVWHVNPSSELEARDERLNQHQGRNLMAGAALRVWEELYVCKKPAIEEVFKVTLAAPAGPGARAPDLGVVREQVCEAATRLWLAYVDGERKATYRVPWELHQGQLQSKIHKVTGGLTRLASRTKVRKEEVARVKVRVRREHAAAWMLERVALVRGLADMRRQQHANTARHTQRYVHQEWLQTETELTRERGLWGPPTPCHLDKWMLDMTEGPARMRKKLMKNDLFYLHYPYRPEYERGQLKYKVAASHHSKQHHALVAQSRALGLGAEPPAHITAASSLEDAPAPPPALPPLARLRSEPDDQQDDGEPDENELAPADNQTLLRLLEENEKVSHMFRCARIQGLDTTEGLLLFGLEHCYVVDGFTLLKSREIRDIESLPDELYEPILPSPGGSPARPRRVAVRHCSKFSYEEIREVHKRRYLLQPMALEVFSGDGRNYLLAFPRKVRNKVYQRFMATATGIADSAQQSVAGQKRTANVEQAAGLLSSLIGETSVTQRWVRGEISNFQYLMHLNTLAGRSYNDLMQYPVFPWILADYDSEELDLTDARTFRDFARPMGAQSPERLEQFRKRFKEWDDPHGETPPYHYGTHYSSAMIVCSYLVRMEPFTQHFLRLQGGHFDLADRMFNSVKEAWLSASKHNMADVKELIPEFFYLPEFLCNSNCFDLGTKQSGVSLGDIVLPPWARQDPREFIRVHRAALECDYVSQHLHHWIDLIFGCKQQGQPAVEAVNVFHHLFYEGNVDIYNIDDPLKKNATIGFINNFGQIPKQLFKKAHPCKKMGGGGSAGGGGGGSDRSSVIETGGALVQALALPAPEKLFFHHLDNLRPSLQPIKEVKGPVGQILHTDKAILAVEQNKVLIPPAYNKYVAWGFADHSLRVGHYDSDKALLVCESAVQNIGEVVACVCPSPKLVVTAGTSSVVTVWEYEARRKQLAIKQNLYAHTDAVTCLAASPAYNVIVSGSRDCTAVLWDLSRGLFVRQLRGHAGPVAAVAVNDLTGDIATCAATWLHVWSINGDELATVNTCVGRADRMQQILCVAFSQTHEWDAHNVIMTGSTDGVARMWSMDYVQVPVSAEQQQQQPAASKQQQPVRTPIHHRLVKQVNVSSESAGAGSLVKSGSESSLSEDGRTGCGKEWHSGQQRDEKDVCSDTEECTAPPQPQPPAAVTVTRRRRSRVNAVFRKSEGGSTEGVTLEVCGAQDESGAGMRTSKSDTSLTDSFVMIPEVRRRPVNPASVLRSGFRWQRQLVFRSKLTMHTAYDRKDNAEPASVTALAVSKEHRNVYVGDARGRVFSWSVCEVPGRAADHWLKDEGADFCASCSVRFTLYERKHHCRNCGQVFCSKCSRFESEISRLRILKPVRVCQSCYAALRSDSNS